MTDSNANTGIILNSKRLKINTEDNVENENKFIVKYDENCDLQYSSNNFNTKTDTYNDKDIQTKLYNTDIVKNATQLDKEILSLKTGQIFKIPIDNKSKENSQNLNDDDDEFNYLLEKNKFNLSAINEEKSWQIVSQTMKQLNPTTYMTAYIAEKTLLRLDECAKLAKTLHARISTNERWITEEDSIVDSIRCEKKKTNFKIFTLLSPDLQYNMLCSVYRRRSKDYEFRCFVICFMLEKWKHRCFNEAISLICALIKEEASADMKCSVNKFRKLLVIDLLPGILIHGCLPLPPKLLPLLLQKSIEYYFCNYFQNGIFSVAKTEPSTTNAPPPECDDSQYWIPLEFIVLKIGTLLNWQLDNFFSLNHFAQLKFNITLRKQVLYSLETNLSKDVSKSEKLGLFQKQQQLFYISILCFLRLATEYVNIVCPMVKDASYIGTLINILFTFDEEIFSDKSMDMSHLHKEYPASFLDESDATTTRIKMADSVNDNSSVAAKDNLSSVSGTTTDSATTDTKNTVTDTARTISAEDLLYNHENKFNFFINFDVHDSQQSKARKLLMACWSYWQMMSKTPFMQPLLENLFQSWSIMKSNWMNIVLGDISMCMNDYNIAISIFSSIKTANIKLNERIQMQVAICNFLTNNYKLSLDKISSLFVARMRNNCNPEKEEIFKALSNISKMNSIEHARILQRLFGPKNSITMITCDLYPDYMVHFIINYYWSKAFNADTRNDISMGHVIVMLQYDWPRYKPIYDKCLNHITSRNSFDYRYFYDFVKSIPIMAGMSMLEKTNTNMKICLLPQKKISKRSMTRRMTKTQDLAKSNSVFRNLRKSNNLLDCMEEFLLMICKIKS